ncbi:MAG: hypothetical protein ABJB16_05895, partial [Saprospiraceae bacterium]
MKTQLFTLLCLVFFINHSFCQSDNQWLISNGIGKEGLNPDNTNKFQNPITGNFTLFEIANPVRTSTRPSRNDIFAIYADGQHYNTRFEPNAGSFYPANPAFLVNTVHNFTTSIAGGVAYLYLTNRYEGDDPPTRVRAASTIGTPTAPLYTVQTTAYSGDTIIEANHDVVRNKDITIIIDQSKLPLQEKDSRSKQYFLVFDSIRPIGTSLPVPAAGNYFGLRNVFYNTLNRTYEAGFPFNTYNATQPQKINLIFDPTKPYTYINLRATSSIIPFGPDTLGNARYMALFRILDESNHQVSVHTENIVASHDPNFIRVDSICKASHGKKIVYYYLQFRNTSKAQAASGLFVNFELPAHSIESSFKVSEWSPAGDTSARQMSRSIFHCKLRFDPYVSLSVCASPVQTEDCTGYLKFSIAFPETFDVTLPENSLELINPEVTFDSPVVHATQRGRAITATYLSAAAKLLGTPDFRYIGEWRSDDGAVLEFTPIIDGITINGVDIIQLTDDRQ